jgi:hypothetical protein
MEALISICIPTYHRPLLLKETIESCLVQKYRPLEIVIRDNSENDETSILIDNLVFPEGVTVNYYRHVESLGPARNANSLFDAAAGSRLLLLHDDDLLCAGGLDRLHLGWNEFPGARCIYGNQYVINEAGDILTHETERVNEEYFRRPECAGRQGSGLEAALRQQFPHNGFLIETALAREVRYRLESEVGYGLDTDFAIRVGMAVRTGELVYLDCFVSKYRLTQSSLLRSIDINNGHHLLFSSVQNVKTTTPMEREAQNIFLNRICAGAVLDAALAGNRYLALRLLLSEFYQKPVLSKWTILRLICLVSPSLGAYLRRVLRS